MRKFFKLFSFILFVNLILTGCKNPAYELNVLFDANVIEYKATIILSDASGAALPNNLQVSVSGQDAASVYDFSGTKTIPAPNGVITIGLEPKSIPTSGQTRTFNIIVKGTGYTDKNIPVSIAFNQFSQILEVTMLKSVVPSPVSTVITKDTPLSPSGATTSPFSITTPTSGTVAQATTVTIPTGTQFKDASGAILMGSDLSAQVINFDASDPAALALFPGGKLSAANVVGEDGETGSAFFIPAGFTDIQMFVAGKQVKSFSAPITVGIELDPTFKPIATGQVVKPGDLLSVYSYQVETGQFKFETLSPAIENGSGNISVSFPTNHLTIFIVGDVVSTTDCSIPSVTFLAPWLGVGTQPVSLDIYDNTNTKLLASSTIILKNGLVYPLTGLPSVAVKYKVVDNAGKVLSEGSISDPCAGGNETITVGAPDGPAVQSVTLVLNVNCPGKGTIIVPNFDLFYKSAGAPNSEYKLLGMVERGMLKSTLLKIGSSYDFRANWGAETKVVGNRPITDLDMSTVVGENDFLGTKSPNYNKTLLIEACKNH